MPFAIKKGRFKQSTPAKCTSHVKLSKGRQSTKKNSKRFTSMKSAFSVQNNVVNVCCSYLSMVFPYIGNVEYPHGRTYQTKTFQIQAPKDRKRQRLRYISQNDRLPLLSLLFTLEATRSFHSVMSDS